MDSIAQHSRGRGHLDSKARARDVSKQNAQRSTGTRFGSVSMPARPEQIGTISEQSPDKSTILVRDENIKTCYGA
jgi:hypothetical protein